MTAPGIDLLLRPDYPDKSGGDLVLAREYASALNDAGLPAQLRPLSAAAIASGSGPAQVFNVDRFFEFASSAAALRAAGRPYVVAPIHHPVEWVDRFEHGRRPGGLRAIAAVGRTAFGRERIKHVVRRRDLAGVREALVLDVRSAIRVALEGAALIVVQAPGELAEVERTFGASIADRTVWVPNGVTVDESLDTGGIRDIDVLVAGRIEERKNQLRIAQAFASSRLKVTFVGGDNPRNAAYGAEFHRTVAANENLQHVPHVSLEELRGLYVRSKVLFSASRFEVVSLAELEAVAYGCGLVTTVGGYMRDYLGDLAGYVDPGASLEALLGAAERAVADGGSAEAMALVREQYSWAACHRALVSAYRAMRLVQ